MSCGHEFRLWENEVVAALRCQTGAFGNEWLYKLCKEHSDHTNPQIVEAKLWLIGRTYAAALERGSQTAKRLGSDRFYHQAGEYLCKQGIDEKFRPLHCRKAIDGKAETLLNVYAWLQGLLREANGCRRQLSLSSKYLHFHFPHLYYIYDSRAAKGLSQIRPRWRVRANHPDGGETCEYKRFFEKVHRLRKHIAGEWGKDLTPRQMDYLLLGKAKDT